MSTQDWTPVVIHGKNSPKTQHKTKHYEKSKEQKIESSESLSHNKVSASLGKVIREARIAKGFTSQKNLAQALNIPVDVIATYENGKAIPNNVIMQKLRKFLEIKL